MISVFEMESLSKLILMVGNTEIVLDEQDPYDVDWYISDMDCINATAHPFEVVTTGIHKFGEIYGTMLTGVSTVMFELIMSNMMTWMPEDNDMPIKVL